MKETVSDGALEVRWGVDSKDNLHIVHSILLLRVT